MTLVNIAPSAVCLNMSANYGYPSKTYPIAVSSGSAQIIIGTEVNSAYLLAENGQFCGISNVHS